MKKIFDFNSINRLLESHGIPRLKSPKELVEDASTSLPTAQRFVLSWLLNRKEGGDNPQKLAGHGASELLIRGLEAEGTVLPEAATRNLQAAFSRPSGNLVRKVFDHNRTLRKGMPCALAVPYWGDFAGWVLAHRTILEGITAEDVVWFLLESAEDPSLGIIDTWLRNPAWQARWPNPFELDRWKSFSLDLPLFDPRFKPFETFWNLDPENQVNKKRISLFHNKNQNKGINIIAHFCYPSGLKEAAVQMNRAVEKAGGETSLRDFPSSFHADLPARDRYLGLEQWPVTALVLAPEQELNQVYWWSGLHPTHGKHRIGVWYWELEQFPNDWVQKAQQYREIWAPTRFIAESLRKKLDIPVVHLLPGVELTPWKTRTRTSFGLPENEFLFLYIFDMCSVFERKNPMGVIEAFFLAFPHGGARLVVKVNRGDFNPEGLAILQFALKKIGGILINETYSREDTYALMDCCDAYVSLHRSEGFGLTMAEAMLMGKPVIATGYSGNLDFMDAQCSCLVPYQMKVLDKQYHVYPKGSSWADPSLEKAAQAMLWVRNHPEEVAKMAHLGRKRVEHDLDPKAAGERYLKRAQILEQNGP